MDFSFHRPNRLIDYYVSIGIGKNISLFNNNSLGYISDLILHYGANDPPNGYEKILFTINGHSANLNNKVIGESIWLCVSRSKNLFDSVSDVKMLEKQQEKLPANYSSIKVNNYQATSKLSMHNYSRVYISRDSNIHHSSRGLLDVLILRSSDNCPVNYVQSAKPISSSALSDDLYLAYRYESSNLFDLPYKPVMLDRFPLIDLKNSPLPDSVALFCNPEGIQLIDANTKPQHSLNTFILTTTTGVEMYCTNLTFYEEIQIKTSQQTGSGNIENKQLAVNIEEEEADIASNNNRVPVVTFAIPSNLNKSFDYSKKIFCPHTIAIVSYWPYYSCFGHYLIELYNRSLLYHANNIELNNWLSIPLERYITNLFETPLPNSPLLPIQLAINTKTVQFNRLASEYTFPHIDIDYLLIFRYLSFHSISVLLAAILAERKIVLLTNNPSLLTPICEIIRSLLFPFRWQYAFIPLLPSILNHVSDAPMPIFIGINQTHQANYNLFNDNVCIVNIDTDQVKLYGEEKKVMLPESILSKIKKELDMYINVDQIKQTSNANLLTTTGGNANNHLNQSTVEWLNGSGVLSRTSSSSSVNSVLAIRSAYLYLILYVVDGVDDCLLFPSFSDGHYTVDQLFSRDKFLSNSSSKSIRSFLKLFLSTQMFSQFIEERTYSANSQLRSTELLFLNTCMKYYQSLANSQNSTQAFINFILQAYQANHHHDNKYTAPTPDTTGLQLDDHYLYHYWPKLDLKLIRRPRPVNLKYMRELATLTKATSNTNLKQFSANQRVARVLSPNSHNHLDANSYSKLFIKSVYACWFELEASCIHLSDNIPLNILAVFEQLQSISKRNIIPDEGIYRCVLSICGRFNKKEEAKQIFDTMKKSGVKPTANTYGAYTNALADASNQQHGDNNDSNNKIKQDEFSFLSSPRASYSPAVSSQHNSLLNSSESKFSSLTSSASSRSTGSNHLLNNHSTDPYRLLAAHHARSLIRAGRQLIDWASCCIGVGAQCNFCNYQMNEAEIIGSWLELMQQTNEINNNSICCPYCKKIFLPTLQIRVIIETAPAPWKRIIYAKLLNKHARSSRRAYCISVAYLNPLVARHQLHNALISFKEDFYNASIFRCMHEVLYWNCLYQFNQPTLRPLPNTHLFNTNNPFTKIRRINIFNPVQADSNIQQSTLPSSRRGSCDSLNSGLVLSHRIKNRTIEGSEGLRDRVANNAASALHLDPIASPNDNTLNDKQKSAAIAAIEAMKVSPPALSRLNSSPFDIADSEMSNNEIIANGHRSAVGEQAQETHLSNVHPSLQAMKEQEQSLECHSADEQVEQEIIELISEKRMELAMQKFLQQRIQARALQSFQHQSLHNNLSPIKQTASLISSGNAQLGANNTNLNNLELSISTSSRRNASNSFFSSILPTRVQTTPLATRNVNSSILLTPNLSNSSSSTPIASPQSNKGSSSAGKASSSLFNKLRRRSRSNSLSSQASQHDNILLTAGEELNTSLNDSIANKPLTASTTNSPQQQQQQQPEQMNAIAVSSTDSLFPAAAAVPWFPSRSDAIRPWLRSMLDYFWFTARAKKYYDYTNFCESYAAAINKINQITQYRDEVTLIDLMPNKTIQTIEIMLRLRGGLKRILPANSSSSTSNENSNNTSTGAKLSQQLVSTAAAAATIRSRSGSLSLSSNNSVDLIAVESKESAPETCAEPHSSRTVGWESNNHSAAKSKAISSNFYDGANRGANPAAKSRTATVTAPSSAKRLAEKPSSEASFAEKLTYFLLSVPAKSQPNQPNNKKAPNPTRK
jgi:pentatricopeptide repeat protein